ncbi:MAG: glycosyltransferase family 2 protein [Clostridia bacterium]|nr:glycosyltransferase family 2 protein [Clostridia bacterium]
MKKITVMIPCYNEIENVEAITAAVIDIFEKDETLSKYEFDVQFIDNCSVDGTRDKLEEICAKEKRVKAIFNVKNFGQFNSPFYGMLQAKCDALVLLCCDFQDPVDMIPKFVKEWENGAKIVCGIKSHSKESKLVYGLRTIYYKLIKKFSTIEQIEHFTGFGLYDNEFLDIMRRLDDPIPFLRGVVAEYGYKRKDIEYTQEKRRAGKTHNNWVSLLDAAMLSVTTYTRAGVRLAMCLGFVLSVFNILLALAYIIVALFVPVLWSIWVIPILIAIFLVGSVLMFFTGFVGEYVVAVNKRVIRRPLVVEEKRINWD